MNMHKLNSRNDVAINYSAIDKVLAEQKAAFVFLVRPMEKDFAFDWHLAFEMLVLTMETAKYSVVE